MFNPFGKLFSKGKTINIKNRKRKIKNKIQFETQENSIFLIKKVFKMCENEILICGKVLQGSFKVGDEIIICGRKKSDLKLEAIIEKITTSLVEVNKINSGTTTDMLLKAEYNEENKIFPGNKAYKKTK